MLAPLMATTTLMIAFGTLPDHMVFFELIETIVAEAGEVRP